MSTLATRDVECPACAGEAGEWALHPLCGGQGCRWCVLGETWERCATCAGEGTIHEPEDLAEQAREIRRGY